MDLSIGTFESIDQQIKYAEEMIAQFEHQVQLAIENIEGQNLNFRTQIKTHKTEEGLEKSVNDIAESIHVQDNKSESLTQKEILKQKSKKDLIA